MTITINDCIKKLKENVKDPYAVSYLNAIPESIDCGGTGGLKVQLLYVLENSRNWKGEEARQVKSFIRKWCK